MKTTTETRIPPAEKYKDFKPINPSELDMAFGAASNFKTYAPMYLGYHNSEIQEEDTEKKWRDVVSAWFFRGLPKGFEFIPRPGIDGSAALRHIKTVLGSWEPDHMSKEYIVAFLLGLWFSDIKIGV